MKWILALFLLLIKITQAQEIGKPFVDRGGHSESISKIEISIDDKYALTHSRNQIILWDIEKAKMIRVFQKRVPEKIFNLLKFKKAKKQKNCKYGKYKYLHNTDAIRVSKDCKYFQQDYSCYIFDNLTGKQVKKLLGENGCTVEFTNRNKAFIHFWSSDSPLEQYIQIYDTKKKQLLKKNYSATVIKYTHNQKYLLIGKIGGKLEVYNLINKTTISPEKRNLLKPASILLSKFQKYLFSSSSNILTIWNIKNAKIKHIFKLDKEYYIRSMVESTDGKILVLNGESEDYSPNGSKYYRQILIYNIDKNKITKRINLPDISRKISSSKVALTDDGEYVIFNENKSNTFSIKKIKDNQMVKTFSTTKDYTFFNNKYIKLDEYYNIYSWINNSGKQMLKLDYNPYSLNLIDIKNRKILKKYTNISSDIYKVVFSSKNNFVYILYENGDIQLLNLKSKKSKIFKGQLSSVLSLDISTNNKYIFSSSLDGTIKIWDIKTQKELLTIVQFEDDEWVMITPAGYFNASKRGAKYLNVLTSPMSVTSIDSFYEKFYRPDIVKLALQGKTLDTGLKMSDIKPAPEVEIVGLPNKTTKKQIEVTLKLKDMGGGIGYIRIYRNGAAISLESRTIQRSQKGVVTKKYIIPLEKGKNKIEAIAFENTNSAKSEPPATATIVANYSNHSKPSLHAVVIGIEEFRNQKLNLRYTKADATALKETLERYSKSLFDSVNVTLLTSKEETTKENISKVLTKMKSLNPNDMFLLFVASHGEIDDGNYYLITSNVGSTRTKKLKQDALSQEEITKLISNIPTGKKLILLDTCSAGALGDSIKLALLTRGMSEDTAIKILSRATGTTILSASLSTQQALEGYKGHGLFSYVLLEGLKKEADLNGDGFVKTPELVDYVDERVPKLSEQVFGVEQFPTVNLDGQSFPITRIE